MCKKVIKLTQSDLIKHITNVMSEQVVRRPTSKDDPRITDTGMWMGGSAGPGKIDYRTRDVDYLLDSTLFKNGISQIDKNSAVYKTAIGRIKSFANRQLLMGKEAVVGIVGGASAVGQKQGYDNTALATKRALNFIEAAKSEPGMEKVNFVAGEAQVGVADKKNSPEANREQFVKVYFHTEQLTPNLRAAIESTANFVKFTIPNKVDDGGKIIPGKTVKVCFEINESQYAEFIKRVTGLGYRIIK
jgi:hypothetical protein